MSFSQSSFPPWTPMSPTPGAGGVSWSDFMFDNTDAPLSPIMDEATNGDVYHRANSDDFNHQSTTAAESDANAASHHSDHVHPSSPHPIDAPSDTAYDGVTHAPEHTAREDDTNVQQHARATTNASSRTSSVGGKSTSTASKTPRHSTVSHSTRSKTTRRGKTVRSYVPPIQEEEETHSPAIQTSKKRRRAQPTLDIITEEPEPSNTTHDTEEAVPETASKRPASTRAMDTQVRHSAIEHHIAPAASASTMNSDSHPPVPQTPSPFTVITMSDEECLVTPPSSGGSSVPQNQAYLTSQRIAFAPSRSFVALLDDMLRTNERLMNIDDSQGGINDMFDQFRSVSGILHGRRQQRRQSEDEAAGSMSRTVKQSTLSTRDRCLFATPDGFFEAQPLQPCVVDAIHALGLAPNIAQPRHDESSAAAAANDEGGVDSVFISLLDWISFCAAVPDPTAFLKHARQPSHALAVKTFRKRSSILMHAARYLVFVLDDWLRSTPSAERAARDDLPSTGQHQIERISSASRFFGDHESSNNIASADQLPPLIWRDEHSSIRINCHRDAMLRHMHPSSTATMSDVFYVASASLPALGLFMSASDFWILVASFNAWCKTSMQFHTRFVHVVDLRPDFASAETRAEHAQLRPSSFLSYFDHLLHLASHKQYAPLLTDASKLLDTPSECAPSVGSSTFDFNASSLVFAGSPFTPGMGTLLPCSVHNEIWRPYSLQWMPHHTSNAFIVQANILII